MCLEKLSKYSGVGTLVLRLFIGLVMVMGGSAKVFGGVGGLAGLLAGWPAPMFFAWLVALIELIGGIFLILGIFVRQSSIPLGIIMLVAAIYHWSGALGEPAGFQGAQFALFMLVGLVTLLFQGAGSCSLDCKMCKSKKKGKK